jgi:hypothetical protein
MRFNQGWLDIAQEYNLMGNSWDRGGVQATHLVIHGTAGGSDGGGVASYMGTAGVSTHFVISTDGTIWQCISADSAAWGNAPLNAPRLNFARADLNPNLWTISIEFCKPDITNQINITDAQKQSGFPLIKLICETYGIPKKPGDGNSGIISHADINSVDRARCPGTFPWSNLWAYLKGSSVMLPQGWSDNGTTLSCNNFVVVKGFRDYVLQHLQDGTWRGDDVPCENEQSVKQLEQSNPGLGSGSRQRFRYSTLEYTQDRGVFQAYVGPELIKQEQLLILANAQIQQQAAQIQQLQKQQPAPTPPMPANVSQAVQAINAIGVMAEQLKSDGDTISSAVKNALVALGK